MLYPRMVRNTSAALAIVSLIFSAGRAGADTLSIEQDHADCRLRGGRRRRHAGAHGRDKG